MTIDMPDTRRAQRAIQKRTRGWWNRLGPLQVPTTDDLTRLRDRAAALAGRIEMPNEVELPTVEMPTVDLPKVVIPKVELPKVELPKVDLPKVVIPNVELRNVDLPEISRQVRARMGRPVRRTSRWPVAALAIGAIAVSGAIGAFAAYLLDPERGHARRIETADRLAAAGRRAGRQLGRSARYAASTAGSLGQRVAQRTWSYAPANDAALAEKVESELFRDASIDKGRLNINVENGVVILRGTAATAEECARIVTATWRIAGVRDVQNLLHVPSVGMEAEMAVAPGYEEELPANPGL